MIEQDGIRMIEFFSGIGGMKYAVDNVLSTSTSTLKSCRAFDISLHANSTYKHNVAKDENSTSSCSTKLVEQLKPKDLDGKADLWTMSPPCQPFTTTRGSKSLDMDDKRCNGFKGIIALLTTIQSKPTYILLENVKGFKDSQMIQEWYTCLKSNGYTFKEYLVSPIQLGIPNHRQRYYTLCEHSDRWKDVEEIQTDFSSISGFEKLQQRVVADYLDPSLNPNNEQLQDFLVPDSVLEKDWARQVGVVTKADSVTHCFTAGYGRIFHKATGSLLLMKRDEPIVEKPLDRSNMIQYSKNLRRFTPKELLSLFGFPSTFEFPDGINLEHQYKLIGNSINVTVVTLLVRELLLGDSSPSSIRNLNKKSQTLQVGGVKGHIYEEIEENLLQLFRSYRWKMIPNCTGRYTCRDHEIVSLLAPLEVLEKAGISIAKEFCFELPGRPDQVCVVPLDEENETGIITFVKKELNEGTVATKFVHTLNTPSGFRRKLSAIGIDVTSDSIQVQEKHD